jgi:hypothetical protein
MFDKLVLLIRGDTRWHSRKSRKPHIVGECGKKTLVVWNGIKNGTMKNTKLSEPSWVLIQRAKIL